MELYLVYLVFALFAERHTPMVNGHLLALRARSLPWLVSAAQHAPSQGLPRDYL